MTRRIGVVGTLVWDTIHKRDAGRAVVEEWGGIAYGLGALEAHLPEGWEIVPLVKVGADLAERAGSYLSGLSRIRLDQGFRVVQEANNRVELRYQDHERRTERLSGGVPPWTFAELEPMLGPLDALYVNYISGFEMDLETALALRGAFAGPIYMDLHSLFLGVSGQGVRTWQELPEWGTWIQAADVVQMNEAEFELVGRASGDSWALAAGAVGRHLGAILITLSSRGAAYVAAPDFDARPEAWADRRRGLDLPSPAVSGRVGLSGSPVTGGDPTGCGDVWGATCFARLLAGVDLEGAMESANEAAARNAALRGAEGLARHLGGRLSEPGVKR